MRQSSTPLRSPTAGLGRKNYRKVLAGGPFHRGVSVFVIAGIRYELLTSGMLLGLDRSRCCNYDAEDDCVVE